MLQEAGSEQDGLPPDPTQNQYSRCEFGRSHQDGIRDNLFREFILSLVPPSARKLLVDQLDALKTPRGSMSLTPYAKTDKTGYTVFNKSAEKLKDKKNWRLHRLLFDLKLLFKPGSQKTTDVHQVAPFLISPQNNLLFVCIVVDFSSWTHGGSIYA
jgi:hypothetical protein